MFIHLISLFFPNFLFFISRSTQYAGSIRVGALIGIVCGLMLIDAGIVVWLVRGGAPANTIRSEEEKAAASDSSEGVFNTTGDARATVNAMTMNEDDMWI